MANKKRQPNINGKKSIWNPKHLFEVLNPKNANRIWWHLIHYPDVLTLEQIPWHKWSIGENAKQRILHDFVMHGTKVVEVFESSRGDTIKLLIELFDGHRIETVIMKHHKRTTVCLSSQVGCRMGCRFCATGTMGIIGDLDACEIIEQLVYANRLSTVRNVVFMGMGEPLNNYENVKVAAEFMVDTKRFSLSPKHVTVSTVGVIKNMYRLSDEIPHINLALSLHAPNQTLRKQIIPTAGSSPIEELILAVKYHIDKNMLTPSADNGVKSLVYENANNHNIDDNIDDDLAITKNNVNDDDIIDQKEVASFTINPTTINTGNNVTSISSNVTTSTTSTPIIADDRITTANNAAISDSNAIWKKTRVLKYNVMIEYILIADLNDTSALAHELGILLQPLQEYVLLNLIPYNPTEVKEDFKAPSTEAVENFKNILFSAPYCIHTRVRVEMGQDIAGACGQLVLNKTAVKEDNKSDGDYNDDSTNNATEIEDILSYNKGRNNNNKLKGNVNNSKETVRKSDKNSLKNDTLIDTFMNTSTVTKVLTTVAVTVPLLIIASYFISRRSRS